MFVIHYLLLKWAESFYFSSIYLVWIHQFPALEMRILNIVLLAIPIISASDILKSLFF